MGQKDEISADLKSISFNDISSFTTPSEAASCHDTWTTRETLISSPVKTNAGVPRSHPHN